MENRGDMKIYQDESGQVYRFLWGSFAESFRLAAGSQGSRRRVKERLADEAGVTESAVENHLRPRGKSGAGFPCDIFVVRAYGRLLAGDENAFLEPYAPRPATQVGTTSPEAVKILESCYESWEVDDMLAVKEIFRRLWELLGLYAATDCFNRRPDTGELDGAEEYFAAEIDAVRRLVDSVEGGMNRRFLQRIVRETEDFVKRYERPGVDDRWLELNSRLGWFDPVFDLADELPAEELARLEEAGRFRVPLPTPWERELRRLYFSAFDGNEDELFTRELQETLVRAFQEG